MPVAVAFNILWPESADVTVRTTATLRSIRGGDVTGAVRAPRSRDGRDQSARAHDPDVDA